MKQTSTTFLEEFWMHTNYIQKSWKNVYLQCFIMFSQFYLIILTAFSLSSFFFSCSSVPLWWSLLVRHVCYLSYMTNQLTLKVNRWPVFLRFKAPGDLWGSTYWPIWRPPWVLFYGDSLSEIAFVLLQPFIIPCETLLHPIKLPILDRYFIVDKESLE